MKMNEKVAGIVRIFMIMLSTPNLTMPCPDGPDLKLYGYYSTNHEDRTLFDALPHSCINPDNSEIHKR